MHLFCHVWVSEQTAIFFPIRRFFIAETDWVYCAVRFDSLNKIQVHFLLNLIQFTAVTPFYSTFAPYPNNPQALSVFHNIYF
jgi:hypothetical protein